MKMRELDEGVKRIGAYQPVTNASNSVHAHETWIHLNSLTELLHLQARRPSVHVRSLFSSSPPHCPLQAPSGAQQLDSPFGLVPHLGHLAMVVVVLTMTAIECMENRQAKRKLDRRKGAMPKTNRAAIITPHRNQVNSYFRRLSVLQSKCDSFLAPRRRTSLSKRRWERSN